MSRSDEHVLSRRRALQLGGAGLSLAALPWLAAACGGGTSSTGSSPNASGGPSSGTVMFQGWDYKADEVQQNLDRFSQLNPKIQVKYTPITSSQYVQKMVAQFTAGAEPDGLYVYDDSMAGWITAGYLQPLEGLPGLDEIYGKLYSANASAMSYQGKRYGVPYYTDSAALIYNAEILSKVGISQPPKSLEELEQQALKVKNAGILEHPIGLTIQLQDTWWSWWWALLYANGAKLFEKDMSPRMGTQDHVVRNVLSWLNQAMNKSKVLDPASLQLLPVPLDNAIMAGQYAFTIGARYAARQYNDPARSRIAGQVKLGMIPSLDGKTQGTVSNCRMYGLSKNTKVKDMAWKLVSYLGGLDDKGVPYTAKYWFKKEGLGFAFKDLEKDSEITTQLKTFADPDIYNQLQRVSKARDVITQPWYGEWDQQNQKLTQQVLTGQLPAGQAETQVAANATKLKKQYS